MMTSKIFILRILQIQTVSFKEIPTDEFQMEIEVSWVEGIVCVLAGLIVRDECLDFKDLSLLVAWSSSESVYDSRSSLTIWRLLEVWPVTVWPTSKIALPSKVNRNTPIIDKTCWIILNAPVATYIAMAKHMARVAWR